MAPFIGIIAFLVLFVSALGVIYPFRPFRTRLRALLSIVASVFVLIGVGMATDGQQAPARAVALSPYIGRGDALKLCRQAARDAATNPHSVDFSIFMDASYLEMDGAEAAFRSTFTAKNAFNAESKFTIVCLFDGKSMVSSDVFEAR